MMKVTLTLSVCLFPERLKLRLPDDRRRESADLCKDRIPQGECVLALLSLLIFLSLLASKASAVLAAQPQLLLCQVS